MKKSLKAILIVLASLGLILAGVLYFVHFELEDFVRGKLDEQLDASWQVEFRELSVSLFSLSFDVIDLEVARTDGAERLWHASVDTSSVEHLHPLQIVFSNNLTVEAIKLSDLKIEVNRLKQKKKKQGQPKKKSNSITFVVNNILIENGQLSLKNDSIGKFDAHMQLKTKKIKFDSLAQAPLQLAEKISLKLSDVKYYNPDSTYALHVRTLRKDFRNEILIDSISYSPLKSLEAFSQYHGWRKSRNTITVDKIEIPAPRMRADSIYALSLVRVVNPQVTLEKDMNYSLPDRHTKLPQEGLNSLGFTFNLDSLVVENGKLEVKIRQQEALVADIVLDNVSAHAKAQNYTQDSIAFGFSGEATALNGSSLKVNSEYRYADGHPWNLTGSLSDTDLEFFSTPLRKLAGIEISSGQLNKLDFDMDGSTYGSKGQVTFLYDNLSINAVDKETGKKKVVLNTLADVLGSLVFWKQNPREGKVRQGNYEIERDVRKAFPSQWIDGLLEGIIDTVAKIDPAKIRKMS